MKVANCVKMALVSLKVHKLRSLLTGLGIIIGVAVVSLVACPWKPPRNACSAPPCLGW
jgi:hypothetical protein